MQQSIIDLIEEDKVPKLYLINKFIIDYHRKYFILMSLISLLISYLFIRYNFDYFIVHSFVDNDNLSNKIILFPFTFVFWMFLFVILFQIFRKLSYILMLMFSPFRFNPLSRGLESFFWCEINPKSFQGYLTKFFYNNDIVSNRDILFVKSIYPIVKKISKDGDMLAKKLLNKYSISLLNEIRLDNMKEIRYVVVNYVSFLYNSNNYKGNNVIYIYIYIYIYI